MPEDITITLTEDQARFAERMLTDGHYESFDALVADALEILLADMPDAAPEEDLAVTPVEQRE